jgi:hypothetical protein
MHGLKTYRRALARLGTTKLDQRSAVAISVTHFKADVIRDEFPARRRFLSADVCSSGTPTGPPGRHDARPMDAAPRRT